MNRRLAGSVVLAALVLLLLCLPGGRAQDAPDGTLELRSDPPGATVVVNGRELGTTPFTGTLRPGTYDVDLTLEGHAPLSFAVRVAAGSRTMQLRTLSP